MARLAGTIKNTTEAASASVEVSNAYLATAVGTGTVTELDLPLPATSASTELRVAIMSIEGGRPHKVIGPEVAVSAKKSEAQTVKVTGLEVPVTNGGQFYVVIMSAKGSLVLWLASGSGSHFKSEGKHTTISAVTGWEEVAGGELSWEAFGTLSEAEWVKCHGSVAVVGSASVVAVGAVAPHGHMQTSGFMSPTVIGAMGPRGIVRATGGATLTPVAYLHPTGIVRATGGATLTPVAYLSLSSGVRFGGSLAIHATQFLRLAGITTVSGTLTILNSAGVERVVVYLSVEVPSPLALSVQVPVPLSLSTEVIFP